MKKTHHVWTEEMRAFLTKNYPSAPWDALQAGLPGLTRRAIYQQARELHLSRWNQGNGVVGSIVAGNALEVEIGWLAGALDGEGTLTLARQRRHADHKREYLTPKIVIYNTNREFAEKVFRLMGGYIFTSRTYPKWNRLLPIHMAILSGSHETTTILSILLPHLTVKRERALMLLEFAELRRSRPSKGEYGEEEYALWRRFFADSKRAHKARPHLFDDSYANPEPTTDDESVGV